MKRQLAVGAFCLLFISACTDQKGAIKNLQDLGFTDIEITGYRAFSCSEDDFYRTGFKAISPQTGNIVTGTVCGGIFKGSTVRFD